MKATKDTNTLSKDKDFLLSSIIGKKVNIDFNDDSDLKGILKNISNENILSLQLDFDASTRDNDEFNDGTHLYPTGVFFIPLTSIRTIVEENYEESEEEEEEEDEEESEPEESSNNELKPSRRGKKQDNTAGWVIGAIIVIVIIIAIILLLRGGFGSFGMGGLS